MTKSLVHRALLFMALLGLAHAKVLTLTQGDFYSTIKGPPKKWFVKFYAEWCGHCKRLRPIWDELSESVDESDIGIAMVDATKNRDLADSFGVRGYPTLIYIHDANSYYRYAGGRTLEEMQAFLQGGYKEGKPDQMPSPPQWGDLMERYKKLAKKEFLIMQEDFYHIMAVRKNAMAAFLIIGGIVGCLLGCLLGALCCRGGGGKKKTKIE